MPPRRSSSRSQSAVTEPGSVDVALYRTVEEEIDALIEAIKVDPAPLRETAILVRIGRENGAIVQALRAAGIPFEIVGLEGLLSQPEVLDLLAVLEVVNDVTANPAMLRLLTGPRWRIGTRDLALLGRRASTLSGRTFGRKDDTSLEAELARAVEGTDPTEIVALADAVDDPGELAYSPEALQRFGEISQLIASVRRHASEPLLELARRAIRALDLDLELEAGAITGGADNIALFLEAISDYAQSDRYASLSGLVAYLAAEDFYNEGMSVATPSDADSVKLLTIHRSKGLEWHSVYVPLTSRTIFPSARGRGRWTTNAQTLPNSLRGDRDSLPVLTGWSPAEAKAFNAADKFDAQMEERRLGYVAYTRAARRLVVSGHIWGRTQQKPLGASEYLVATRDWLAEQGRPPLHWAEPPPDEATNPHFVDVDGIAWPASGPELAGRRALADDVRAAAARQPRGARPRPLDRARPHRRAGGRHRAAARRGRRGGEPAQDRAVADVDVGDHSDGVCRTIPQSSPDRWHGRCRGDHPVLRDSAPGSTPGSRPTSASRRCSTRPTCPDAVMSASGRTPSLRRSRPHSSPAPTPTSRRYRSRRRSRSCSAASSSSAASTPCSRRRRARTRWSTGRPTSRLVQIRCSSRSTGSPGQSSWASIPSAVTGSFYYARLGEVKSYADLPGREELEATARSSLTVWITSSIRPCTTAPHISARTTHGDEGDGPLRVMVIGGEHVATNGGSGIRWISLDEAPEA